MTSQPDTGAPAGTAPDPPADDDSRLGRLEARVSDLADAIRNLVPGSHAEAQQRTGERLDSATTVQQQVRDELERARQEEAAAADAARAQSEQQQIREDLARLREQPPAAPVPRRTKLLGWGDQ